MTEQSVPVVDPALDAPFGYDCFDVVELLTVGVVSEGFWIGEVLPVFTDAASGKIESDGAKSCFGELLCYVGKEREVSESLESMADHDCTLRILGQTDLAANYQRP